MNLIDISHLLSEDTPIYTGDYKTTLQKLKSIENDHYCSYLLTSCLHTGTHIDLPMHLLDDNRVVADFELNNFIGTGVLLDVRGEKLINMKTCYEDMITNESIVLLYTGFDKFYSSEEYFTQHPVVSEELADFMISKNIKMLGMDMPSPDYPPFTVHKKLFSHDIFIMENVTKLHSLIGINSFEVIAFPIKISAEASFIRAVCRIINEE
jgi:kynurenine formamidase